MEQDTMDQNEDKSTIKNQLQQEVAKWQTKIDEAKLQLNLAAMDAHDKLQPHVEQLDLELHQAQEKWQKFESASGSAWQDIQHGLKMSFKSMQQSFDKAQQHFKKDT